MGFKNLEDDVRAVMALVGMAVGTQELVFRIQSDNGVDYQLWAFTKDAAFEGMRRKTITGCFAGLVSQIQMRRETRGSNWRLHPDLSLTGLDEAITVLAKMAEIMKADGYGPVVVDFNAALGETETFIGNVVPRCANNHFPGESSFLLLRSGLGLDPAEAFRGQLEELCRMVPGD